MYVVCLCACVLVYGYLCVGTDALGIQKRVFESLKLSTVLSPPTWVLELKIGLPEEQLMLITYMDISPALILVKVFPEKLSYEGKTYCLKFFSFFSWTLHVFRDCLSESLYSLRVPSLG